MNRIESQIDKCNNFGLGRFSYNRIKLKVVEMDFKQHTYLTIEKVNQSILQLLHSDVFIEVQLNKIK